MIRCWILCKTLIALVLCATPTVALALGEKRVEPREERVLMAKFSIRFHTRCTSCAFRIVQVLKQQKGVRDAQVVPKEDAAVAFFTPGETETSELVHKLRVAGFDAALGWGPVAASLNGNREHIPDRELPRPRMTQGEYARAEKAKREAYFAKVFEEVRGAHGYQVRSDRAREPERAIASDRAAMRDDNPEQNPTP